MPANLLEILANGIQQNVAVAGPADAPPVLLIHGLGWDHTLWDAQTAMLAGGGWRVVAPDLRGMGASDKPRAAYSVGLFAEDLLSLMDTLGVRRFATIGFSLGGMVAAAMLEKAPDRVAAASLACCGVHATPRSEAATEAMLERAQRLGAKAFAREQAEAIWHPDWAANHPDEVERFIRWRADMDQEALSRGFRASYGVDYREALARATQPVRFVASSSDPFASVETMSELKALTPNSDLVIIDDAGHMAPIERSDAFNAALREFLSAVWPAGASRHAFREMASRSEWPPAPS